MKNKKKERVVTIPNTNELENELNKVKYLYKYKSVLKSTLYVLIVVIAISVLISTLIFPVLKIYGKSMSPTLVEGDIALSVKKSKYENGDIIAFYYNNRILIKRVIATSSEWVNINENGDVFVNNELLEELYIEEKSLGESDITYPYQVPENAYFVLGDDRNSSIDSRNSIIGTIKEDEIIGKVIFKVWPIRRIGFVKN